MSSVFNNIVSTASNYVASLNVPDKVHKVVLATSKEGPMAVLPPEIAVTGGRSMAAAKRSGFLEFQERFIEEIMGAAVWLGGVKVLSNVYDKFLNKWFPHLSHLDSSVAWDGIKKKGMQSVELSALERFAPNAKQKRLLTYIKGGKLGFSVLLATFTAAIIVPWLNKVKTDWIIKNFYNKKKEEAPNAEQALPIQKQGFSIPNFNNQSAVSAVNTIQSPAQQPNTQQGWQQVSQPVYNQPAYNAPAYPGQNYSTQNQWGYPVNGAQPAAWPQFAASTGLTPAQTPVQTLAQFEQLVSPVQFSGIGESVSKALQSLTPGLDKLGHSIQQTHYGEILSVDVGLTGGRAWSYGQRSPYEAIEVIFRDAASLYFYILCTPHVMALLGRVIEPLFKTGIQLNSIAANELAFELTERILARQPELKTELMQLLDNPAHAKLKQAILTKDMVKINALTQEIPELKSIFTRLDDVGASTVREIILGNEASVLKSKTSLLTNRATQANTGKLAEKLTSELKLYGVEGYQQQVDDFLTAVRKNTASVTTTDELHKLLTAIKGKEGVFAEIAKAEQANLMMAIKQAFRQDVGVHLKDLSEKAIKDALPELFEQLPDEYADDLVNRVRTAARQGSLDQVNALTRHHINVIRETMMQVSDDAMSQAYDKVMDQTDAMTDWLEKAVTRRVSVDEAVRQDIFSLKQDLLALNEKNKFSDDIKSIIQQLGDGLDNKVPTLETLETLEAQAKNIKGQKMASFKNLLTGNAPIDETISHLKAILYPEEAFASGLDEQVSAELKKAINKVKQAITGVTRSETDTLGDRAIKNLAAMMEKVEQLAVQEGLSAEKQTILSGLREEIKALSTNGKGRIFSLYTSAADEKLGQFADEILKGGMVNDSRILNQMRAVMGALPGATKFFVSQDKLKHVQKDTNTWLKKFLDHMGWQHAEGVAKEGVLTGSKFMDKSMHYLKLSRNSHILGRLIALTVASLGLGWLVPKIQYAITKKLTGKNEHPGFGVENHDAKPKPLTTIDMMNQTQFVQRKPTFNLFENWRAQYEQQVPQEKKHTGHGGH